MLAEDQSTDHDHSSEKRTAGPVLSWASGGCNVDSFVALQVLELKAGEMCCESSGPCLDGGEWDLQLLSALGLHGAEPGR